VAVLGGAAFAGEAAALAESVAIPVVGGVEAAAAQALALTRLAARKPRTGSYAAPSRKAMQGLSPGLARKLALGGPS
jgi:Asp/Glu/hydantoin racemase